MHFHLQKLFILIDNTLTSRHLNSKNAKDNEERAADQYYVPDGPQ